MSITASREKPRTSQAWPRLSQTLPVKHPHQCGQCGVKETGAAPLGLWQECDQNDKPEMRYVLLCEGCSSSIIEPHVRLYFHLDRNAPAPGAMGICADCKFRDGLWCARAKANGGDGVTISAAPATRGFIDGRDSSGRRWGREMTFYGRPPSACSAKVPS